MELQQNINRLSYWERSVFFRYGVAIGTLVEEEAAELLID
jgi:hypothetical protein